MAAAAEDVLIKSYSVGNALLAALVPAAETLKALDAVMPDDLVCPQPLNPAMVIAEGLGSQPSEVQC